MWNRILLLVIFRTSFDPWRYHYNHFAKFCSSMCLHIQCVYLPETGRDNFGSVFTPNVTFLCSLQRESKSEGGPQVQSHRWDPMEGLVLRGSPVAMLRGAATVTMMWVWRTTWGGWSLCMSSGEVELRRKIEWQWWDCLCVCLPQLHVHVCVCV